MGSSMEKPLPAPGAGESGPHIARLVNPLILRLYPLLAHAPASAGSGHRLTRHSLPGPQFKICLRERSRARPHMAQPRKEVPFLAARATIKFPFRTRVRSVTPSLLPVRQSLPFGFWTRKGSLTLSFCGPDAERMPIQDKKCADYVVSRRRGTSELGSAPD